MFFVYYYTYFLHAIDLWSAQSKWPH